jgi:hypothetical protein
MLLVREEVNDIKKRCAWFLGELVTKNDSDNGFTSIPFDISILEDEGLLKMACRLWRVKSDRSIVVILRAISLSWWDLETETETETEKPSDKDPLAIVHLKNLKMILSWFYIIWSAITLAF